MKSRRSFLATVASGGVGLSLVDLTAAAAQTTPSPSPSAKPASAAAAALAAAMRARFDPALTDAELQTIAKAIDANNDAAKALNPPKKRLRNSDVPVVRFAVTGSES